MRVVSMSGHWPWVGSWGGQERGSRHPLGGYYQQLVTHDSSIGNSDKHNIHWNITLPYAQDPKQI